MSLHVGSNGILDILAAVAILVEFVASCFLDRNLNGLGTGNSVFSPLARALFRRSGLAFSSSIPRDMPIPLVLFRSSELHKFASTVRFR